METSMPTPDSLLESFANRFRLENFGWALAPGAIHFRLSSPCQASKSSLAKKLAQRYTRVVPEREMRAVARPYRFDVVGRTRSVVRELLLFWLIGTTAIFCFDPSWPPLTLVPAVLFGAIPGFLLWFLFRILRFAFPSFLSRR
jgi:hypothetical protein